MDLKKELKIVRESNAYEIVSNLRDQQMDLEKKTYILQVVDFANCAEKLYEENVFQKSDINMINLSWYHENDVGNVLDYRFKNNFDNTIILLNSEDGNRFSEFGKKTTLLMGFSRGFISESFQEKKVYILKTNENIRENILKLLLSKELKSILDYNELDMDIKNDSQLAGKKIKI